MGEHGSSRTLGVGMIGYGFIGAAHSHAWRTAPHQFDLAIRPDLRVLCGRDLAAVESSAAHRGWGQAETDWRRVVADPEVALVDICTPSALHADIAVAALGAGKHVLCEKPLANTVAEALRATRAAESARRQGVVAMVGFNYRRVPALALARSWVLGGRLGRVLQVRGSYLQDWLSDPGAPLSWRLRREDAGSGALGDLGAHLIDLTAHLTGERFEQVFASTETFVPNRPSANSEHPSRLAEVTVDDAVAVAGRLTGGVRCLLETSRVATGHKNDLRVEVSGELGGLRFELERPNELWHYDHATAPTERGFRRILVTEPTHPYLAAWWPPGHVLGWEHSLVHEVADLLRAIELAEDPSPGFAEGLAVQRVIQAALDSAATGAWVCLPSPDEVDPDAAATQEGARA